MNILKASRVIPLALLVAFGLSRSITTTAAATDYDLATAPLYSQVSDATPLMMLVMSRDEQLFNKAYSDYSDLDGDGLLDSTYNDKFNYEGYFGSKLCYAYASGSFVAKARATGANQHECGTSSYWSGNFLNWLTMSRLDVLRYVLYGGLRIEDTSTSTILERANIPADLHAWAKVYSGADYAKFIGGTLKDSTTSFCNVTPFGTTTPVMYVAKSNWSEWASTSIYQCGVNRTGQGQNDVPKSATSFNVRVKVCADTKDPTDPTSLNEEFCKKYSSAYKPTGLLQQYGEAGMLRFGLITGTNENPRSGGVLRKNIGLFAGNGDAPCSANDEVNTQTGVLCAKTATAESIIKRIDAFNIASSWNNSLWTDCNAPGILNRPFTDRRSLQNPGTGGAADKCAAWGNPLSEMYAEALNYIQARGSNSRYGTGVSWKDPYNDEDGANYCSNCSIMVLASGVNSFDTDELPGSGLGTLSASVGSTNEVSLNEGLNGVNAIVGRVVASDTQLNVGASVNTHGDLCTSKKVNSLSKVRGVCSDSPSTEGGYLISGMAYKAYTTDLRPTIKPAGSETTISPKTYGIELAESLPKFEFKTAKGIVSLAPTCGANFDGGAGLTSSGWRSCFLGSVTLGKKNNPNTGENFGLDTDPAGNYGSFTLVWEDSLWGNDHDNDVISMLSYCVGAACRTAAVRDVMCRNWRDGSAISGCSGSMSAVRADQIAVRTELLSAYAGHAMASGYTIAGTTVDGSKLRVLRPGGRDGSLLTDGNVPTNPNCTGTGYAPCFWNKPVVEVHTSSSSDVKQLRTPLWYASKYGGFDKEIGNRPNNLSGAGSNWDKNNDGNPDNYFLAKDPSKLKAALAEMLQDAAKQPPGAAGGGAVGARLTGDSFTIEASFQANGNDWYGVLKGYDIDPRTTERGDELWDAVSEMPSYGARNIVMNTSQVVGGITTLTARNFQASNLVGAGDAGKNISMGVPSVISSRTPQQIVDYLRGNRTLESSTTTPLRKRTAVLGDIVNSSPITVTSSDDFGYTRWSASGSEQLRLLGESYKEFLNDKRGDADDPIETTLFVGANDGMLHAFNATKGAADAGKEAFAFIPSQSLKKIGQLASPNYRHQYYVDGQMATSHVAFSSTNDWRNVLVGSMAAGGRSVFGLDVSNPSTFSPSSVLWEITPDIHTDMGNVMNVPHIIPMYFNYKGVLGVHWVALFGNGVNSQTGKPVLFLVDVKTGEVIANLQTARAGFNNKNGLMGVAPVDLDGNGFTDTVYAGDMQGNIWRFDIGNEAIGNWKVGLGDNPLFTAKAPDLTTAQQISGEVEVVRDVGGGMRIIFGTGRYMAEGDNESDNPMNKVAQSLYSVTDVCGVNTACTNVVGNRTATNLTVQTIKGQTTIDGEEVKMLSSESYDSSKRGWVLDLQEEVTSGSSTTVKTNGERFFGSPRIQNGLVYFVTYTPTGVSCSPGGYNWMYVLSVASGGAAMQGLSTTLKGDPLCTGEGCGAINLNKKESGAPILNPYVVVPKTGPGVPIDPSVCGPDDLDCAVTESKCKIGVGAGDSMLYSGRPCGRQSWRQIK